MAWEDYQFTSDQNREEAAKNGRKGGKASGKARRLKKSMKQALLELLEEEVKDKKGNKTGKTWQDMVNVGLLKGAVEGKSTNYETIVKLLGEMQEKQASTPNIKLEVVNNEDLQQFMNEKGGE